MGSMEIYFMDIEIVWLLLNIDNDYELFLMASFVEYYMLATYACCSFN